MSKVTFTNFASTRTTSVLSSLNTTFSITPGTGANFPTCSGGDWFYCVLTDSLTAPTVREVVKVASRSGDSFSTVVRAQDGTVALDWPSGSYCELRLTKGALEEIQALLATALQAANDLSDLASVITARSNLGLGNMALQNSSAVTISGGAINGCQITGGTLDITPVGSLSPSTGSFTTLAASGAVSGAGFTAYMASPPAIGGTAPAAGAFTTLTASGATSLAALTAAGIFTANADSYFAGVLYGSGNWSFTPPVADGKFVLQSATADGAMLYGRGTLNDVSIYNRDGSVGLFVRGADISVGTADFLPNIDATTNLGSASFRFKNAFFSGQVKGGAGTGTGAPVMVGTLSVNTTAVGNVGGGTDDLMTYSLPANSLSANGKGVRVTMWGTFANNANAKELYGFFGSGQIAFNIALPTSAAGFWRIVSTTIRTGSNAQTTTSDFQSNTSGGSSAVNMCKTTSTTETDSGAITIKASAVGVSDNDVVQTGMMVEFIN